MTINRVVRIIAGFFIMMSLVFAHAFGQVNLLKLSWLWFTFFVGANLFQSGFTRWCLMEKILARFGVPEM